MTEPHHVVVDGSNLATEGRTLPSLKQLDEAVRAYASEDPSASIIVVVDATFEHRVSDEEREEVRTAMLNGEVISPPAGAIGRGDAFVLRIAERTGATVLSNDSFQEFHGEHGWLFDEGRLIGGKPVPGVGWIFTPRLPIRGPKSRAATAEARSKKRDPDSAPAKAAELARAAKKAAKRGGRSRRPGADTSPAEPVDSSWPLTPTVPPPGRVKVDPVLSSAIEEAVEEALHPVPASSAKSKSSAKKAAPQRNARAKKDSTPAPRQAQQDAGNKRNRAVPPPAVNAPLDFINFVAAFSVGGTIDGEVVSFTSHGAMVDVALPAGGVLHCYIPLTAMGSPPPTKARQVLAKGEVRPFVLAGLDPPRRVAELALPEGDQVHGGSSAYGAAGRVGTGGPEAGAEGETSGTDSGAADRSADESRAGAGAGAGASAAGKPAKKTSGKRAAGKPSAGTKTVDKKADKKAPEKKVGDKKPGHKKPAAKKPAAKKAPAKKAPAKKAAVAKKAAAKKAPVKKSAATKKAAAKKAPAKKAAKAKKAPAKKAAGAPRG